VITLAFRPLHGESLVLVRGAYFRICADGTLRGPDNCITGVYADGIWEVACRQHRAFECGELVELRVTDCEGVQERLGPYDFVRASEGALFTRERCLGMHASRRFSDVPSVHWQEVAILQVTQPGARTRPG